MSVSSHLAMATRTAVLLRSMSWSRGKDCLRLWFLWHNVKTGAYDTERLLGDQRFNRRATASSSSSVMPRYRFV